MTPWCPLSSEGVRMGLYSGSMSILFKSGEVTYIPTGTNESHHYNYLMTNCRGAIRKIRIEARHLSQHQRSLLCVLPATHDSQWTYTTSDKSAVEQSFTQYASDKGDVWSLQFLERRHQRNTKITYTYTSAWKQTESSSPPNSYA